VYYVNHWLFIHVGKISLFQTMLAFHAPIVTDAEDVPEQNSQQLEIVTEQV
jgi:hypothetical protein